MAAIGITAVAQPTTGSVRLTISGAPNAPLTVARTDANGVGVVRQLAGQQPSGGALVLDDYEVALGGVASYTVTPVTPNASYTAGTATVNVDVFSADWLGVPVFPGLNVALGSVVGFTETRDSKTVFHEIVNRADDVANIQDLGKRKGDIDIRCASPAKAREVKSVLERAEYMMLRFLGGAGVDLYFLVEGASTSIIPDPYDVRRFLVNVRYREVKPPTESRQGTLGWNVSTLSAYTVAEARARFGTVANMTSGTVVS